MSDATLASTIPTVIVDPDAPADAALWETPGGTRVLVLRETQTFTNAVTQISHLLPGAHPDQVRRLVRHYLPNAADFGSLEQSLRRTSLSQPETVPLESRWNCRHLFRTTAAYAALASIGLITVGAYVLVDHNPTVEPYKSEPFKKLTTMGHLMCDPVGTNQATCTDVDGTVMMSTAMTGPDMVLFSFAYGADQVQMRVFESAQDARTWSRGEGVRELYQNMRRVGRYVFYGTDPKKIASFAASVADGEKVAALNSAIPDLPVRLGGLAFGALNLPETADLPDLPAQLVSASQSNAVRIILAGRGGPQVEAEVSVVAKDTPPQQVASATRHPKANTASSLPVLPVLEGPLSEKVAKVVAKVASPAKPKPKPVTTPTAKPVVTPPPITPEPETVAPATEDPVDDSRVSAPTHEPVTPPVPVPEPPVATEEPTKAAPAEVAGQVVQDAAGAIADSLQQ